MFARVLLQCGWGLLAVLALQAGQTRPLPGSDHPSSAYQQAFTLLQKGKAQEAVTLLDAELARAPADAQLHNLRGLAALKLGRPKEAEASFRKVVEIEPQRAIGYNNLATLFLQLGLPREAADAFRAALKREPRDLAALAGVARILIAQERYSEAKPYLEQVLAQRPGDFDTVSQLVLANRGLGNREAARKSLAAIHPPQDATLAARYYELSGMIAQDDGKLMEALTFYRRACELNPGSFEYYASLARASLDPRVPSPPPALLPPPAHLNPEQHFALGLLFASHDAFEDAIPHFEETLRREPASYAAAFNLALAYRGAGRLPAAVDLARKVMKDKPTAELANLLASLEESTNDYLSAVRHYQQAVELEPTSEQYYFDLGMEYLVHFTFDSAQEVFRVGTGKFPQAVRQHVGLGYAYYGVREYVGAAEAFLRALEIEPRSPTAYAAWNSLPAFLAPAESQQLMPRLRQLSASNPQSAEAHYCYGVLLLRHGLAAARAEEIEQAQPLLARAIAIKPDFADAHLELGNLYAALKQHEKAAAEFREAVRLNPRSEMGHYRLGQTYRNLQQLEQARQELEIYTNLTRTRHELMARNRAAIKQFILAQSAASPRPPREKPSDP